MDEKLHWLWLSSLKGVGSVTMLKYLRAFNTVTELYDAGRRELEEVEGATKAEIKALSDKSLKRAEEIAEECRMREVRILPVDDPDYPTWLRTIYDPPCVLYVRGELPDLDRRIGLAVVGTRRASKYGLDCASRFGAELADAGAVVISGLAEGIDSAAISAAIKAKGTVVGVLGTGVDRAFPTWNAPLHREAAQHGALVSEYPPGTPSTRGSFPARNRIIAGLSRAVLVIEAPMKSGSLITAARALEEGRDVFAVPGRIDDPNFRGSNALLRDGAVIALEPDDVIESVNASLPAELALTSRGGPASGSAEGPESRQKASKKEVDKQNGIEYIDLKEKLGAFSDAESRVLTALNSGRKSAAELSAELEMQMQDVLAALTMLEIGGYVLSGDDSRYGPTSRGMI
ncbi:MAG: DNA-processing protein DprA [Oscillospiraceae bacterium]|nr:DNA-processing protein DprA [Oscillospiraceae bacterium]